MKELLSKQIDELKDAMLEDIIKVVQIDSVESEAMENAPFGKGVALALDTALEISKKLGFQTKNIDGYMGYAQYGEGDDYVGIIGHLDVVPTGDGWTHPPFSGHVADGNIYARGILDNKGPIMTCLYGLYAIKKLGIQLEKPVRILFGTDEETGFTDLEYYLKKEKPPIMGFTPDCKYPVVYGERGRASLEVSIAFDEASREEKTQKLFQFVNEYFLASKPTGDRLGIDYSDQEFGQMQMRGYQLQTKGNQIAFQFVLSYPAVCTIDEIMAQIQTKMDTGLNLTLLHNYNPVRFEKDCFLVKSLQEAYEEITGLDGTPVTTTGGTYAKGMPNIVPFGPSFPGQKGIGHNPDEWMSIEDLVTNAKIYALSIYKLAV
ncbi:MAG: Sapep family Mn(2+)-dependent dipeptidase [Erysipelotrichaceae bacterium]|nr:Sapep family Mn(2+)-dependent dipeptidase [Erysipelotrichaceae bacterium]